MPYIPPNRREELEAVIEAVQRVRASDAGLDYAGDIAYLIARILEIWRGGERSYGHYALAAGVLETVKLEMYRRLVAPKEDQARSVNGEVFEP